MVDSEIPTSQFHTYQPPAAVPHSERPPNELERLLARAGLAEDTVRRTRIRTREYLRRNRWTIAAALIAAFAVGSALLRGRGGDGSDEEP